MYLLHEPSGYYCYLAKRIGWGWYDLDNVQRNMEKLFEEVETQEAYGDQDAFTIALEGDERCKHIVRCPDEGVKA